VEGAAAEIPGFGGAPGGRTAEDREGSAERLPGGEWVVVGSWWKKGVPTWVMAGKSPGGDGKIMENQQMEGDTPETAVLKVGNLRGHLFSDQPKPTGLGCRC